MMSSLKKNSLTVQIKKSGKWSGTGDQEYVATSGAIAARHDAYVQDNVPAKPAYEQPGKGWHNTHKMWDSHWDPSADKWVAYVNTGPRGVQGPQGIQGPVGPPGEGINVIGTVPNFSDLPTDLGVDDLQFWYVETENILYFWNGSRGIMLVPLVVLVLKVMQQRLLLVLQLLAVLVLLHKSLTLVLALKLSLTLLSLRVIW